MIDVHVLTHSGTRQQWLDQCLESLARESSCTVHVVQGVDGNVGAGRAKGYVLGTHEFVSLVDSDDYVLPGVMDECLNKLRRFHAVSTQEWRESEAGVRNPIPYPRHHMTVYRRADVLPFLERLGSSHFRAEAALRKALKPVQLDFVGYVWRVHRAGAHNNKYLTPDWTKPEN